MDAERREAIYLKQTGRPALTARQRRQLARKNHNDRRTPRHIAARQETILAAVTSKGR